MPKKITSGEIACFTRQMATLLTAGVPLVQSLDIVAKSVEKHAMRHVVSCLKTNVESGHSFSQALRSHPAYFDLFFCNVVHAGETSGALDTMLDRLATYREKTESLKRKIKKALFYPSAVLVVALLVTTMLLICVVPQFEHLFKAFGADLPVFTKIVIGLSNSLQTGWWVILGFILLSYWAFSLAKKKYIQVQHALHRSVLQLPVIGKILHKTAIARFARTLSTTFASGVPLIEALDAVAAVLENSVYRTAILRIKHEVATGSQIQLAMRSTGVFPNRVIQMVAIGEESGALDSILAKVATLYEEEIDTTIDGLSSLLEPVIMVVLGVLIGGLVLAMYLPIFKMGSLI